MSSDKNYKMWIKRDEEGNIPEAVGTGGYFALWVIVDINGILIELDIPTIPTLDGNPVGDEEEYIRENREGFSIRAETILAFNRMVRRL